MEETVKKKPKITIKDIQEINKLYDSGLNCEQVGQTVGRPTSTVGMYIWNPRKRGNSLRTGGRMSKVTKENVQTIETMYFEGYSVREIAIKIGFSTHTVRRYLKKTKN